MSLGGVYTASRAEYESVSLDLPEETVAIADYDFSRIHQYSKLSFDQYEIHARVDRVITEDASIYLRLAYYDLLDNSPYVYGDQEGQVLFSQAGFKVEF